MPRRRNPSPLPTLGVGELVKDMRNIRGHLDSLPDDQKYSMDDTDKLDECRIECFSLKQSIEAILDGLKFGEHSR